MTNDLDLGGAPPLALSGGHNPRSTSSSPLMRVLLGMARQIRIGRLEIVLPDGSRHLFEGPEPGPSAQWLVHRERVARRFLIGGTLGFCEAYLDGDWSSPEIPALFELTLLNEQALIDLLSGKPWFQLLQYLSHRLKPNTRQGSRRNIAYHYDLGNQFYQRWLDPSMTYSSAVFADPAAQEPLSQAQMRKYAEICRRMNLQSGHKVLEIGCGWGGFAEFAAGEVGAKVTAITVSPAQHAYAAERIQRAGLAERVEVRLSDYRDIGGRYDRIASIEMLEAVGERFWPVFFETVHERLVAGGQAALQVITIAERYFDSYRRGADYIQKYIFPGGMLPSLTALRQQTERAGLIWRDAAGYGPHYARTLATWQQHFQEAWPDLRGLGFDGRFKRMWELYLYYCEAGFKAGSIDVVQVGIARG